VANVPGVVYRVSRGHERKVLYVSEGIRALAGWAPDAFLGPEARTLEDLVHADDRKRARAERDRSLDEGRPYSLEYRIVAADDTVLWVLDRGHPVGGCVDGVLIDVSPRRSAIAELERLAAIVDATTDFVGLALPDGRLRYVNRAGRRILGWGEHVLTRQIRDAHPRWASEIIQRLGIPTAIQRGVWVGETAVLDRDGREVPVSQVIMAHRSATGELEFLSTIARDLSERAAAEAASRESEERFRLLASAAFEGIAVTEEGVVVDANEQLAAVLGLERKQLIGRAVMDFVAPESRDDVTAHLRSGSEEPYEHLAQRADGSVFPVEIRARTISSGGRPQRVTALRDVTERKRAEEERIALERRAQHGQKLESLGVLAGGIAHDFNNLLVAVLGNLDLVTAGLPPNSPGRRHLDQAVHAAQRGAGLARELLAYSGRGRFDVRPLDLSALVDEMGQLLRAAVHKTIRLDVRLEQPMPSIMGDASQLQQVVMNLIVNAAEAIGERPGTIVLTTGIGECTADTLDRSRLQEKPPPGRFASIEVTDDGCGMTTTVQQRLFDPFFSTKLAGRGLGMAAVQGIVQGHGGAVLVDTTVGKGTTFRVYLPLASLAAEVAAAMPSRGTPSAEGRIEQGGLVLVVDDEDVVREATRSMVEHLGFSVVAATDGGEAVKLFERLGEHIAFVLLDFTMPVMDGPATLAELRRLRPDVKVLLASGFDQAETSERCGIERPDAFLQKPYRLATLRETVETVVLGRPTAGIRP
jgi:PAS domain S-box-containing protein